jgi:hypothetical protein
MIYLRKYINNCGISLIIYQKELLPLLKDGVSVGDIQ